MFLKREVRLAVDKVRVTEVRFIVVLKAKVVRIPVLKFSVLRILLCGTFLLQGRALSVVVLQLRVLGFEV